MFAAAKTAWLFLSAMPRWAWLSIGGALAMWAALAWHADSVKDAYLEAYNQGVTDTRNEVAAAQAEADRLATVGVAVTTGKQAAISKENSDAFDKTVRDIDARADAIRVRRDAQAEARRAPSRVDLPAPSQAASEPCPAATQDGLPWSVAFPLMIQAEKNQAQLNAILDEIEKQDALAAATEE